MKDFAARRGVVGSVVVESPALVRVVTDTVTETPVADAFARLREAARHRVRAALLEGVPDDERFAIRSMLVALVLGDAEDGYRTIENSFRAVGLSHILAISGFNLAVLGWIVGLAARTVSSVRCSTNAPSARVTITGTISLSKAPDEPARAASSCDRAEKSSSCARLNPHFAAMSSAETPWFTSPSG